MSRRHYRPFLKTVGATLWSSARLVGRQATGRLDPGAVDDIVRAWAREVFAHGEATVEGVGAGRYDDAGRGRAYVVMSNHQSLLDIPSVICTFPGRVRMVGKQELSRVPLWGQAMKAAGIVFVDRQNRAQSIAALEAAKAQLRAGTSIWIAPEGTRSRDGELGPFKKGGFHLARQLGLPIAPAWIEGTRHIVSPDSFGVQTGGHVTVHWGEPIPTDDVGEADLPALMERVRAALLDLQARSRATTTTAHQQR